MPIHLRAEPGDYADACLLPGDPLTLIALRARTSMATTSLSAFTQCVGYLIASNSGASYRLAWTGNADGITRRFTGSVWTQGRFTRVDPGCFQNECGLESEDYISTVHAVAGGNRVDWDTLADGGIDGFDFVVDAQPVMFDFFVDGVRHPESVVFPDGLSGGADASVDQLPFGLISN